MTTLPASQEVVREAIIQAIQELERIQHDQELFYAEVGMLTADGTVLSIHTSQDGTTVKLGDEVLGTAIKLGDFDKVRKKKR